MTGGLVAGGDQQRTAVFHALDLAVQQAQQTKQGPIVAELTKSLDAYAKAHEIGMLFDVAKLGNAVLAAQPELDVTVDFIAEFNASHP